MLQRSSLPASVSADIAESLPRALNRRWLDGLHDMVWLPESARQYAIFLVGALLVGAGMFMHVWLAVQISEERVRLSQLSELRLQIERENSDVIFAIANESTLMRIEAAARMQGFRPATERAYVRRDAVADDLVPPGADGALVGVTALAPPDRATVSATDGGLLDAVGRGLGTLGDWLGQVGGALMQAAGDLPTAFKERWMP